MAGVLRLALLTWLLLGGAASPAHEVAGELRVHALVRPEGERLRVLVRVPLALLANLNLPVREDRALDLAQVESRLPVAVDALVRDVRFYEGDRPLVPAASQSRIAPPADKAFSDFPSAFAAVTGDRLPVTARVAPDQGYLDAYVEYPVLSAVSRFGVEFAVSPGLRERLKLDVRFARPGETGTAYELVTGSPRTALNPPWYQAAWTFVQAGFWHILDGIDHLLFLLCLVIPFRRIGWALVGVVTAFTVAHSITLIAAAYGIVPSGAWFPPLIETLIALSILYMAIENGLRPNLQRRWVITFVFGLVHGFGFSFLLRSQLQFAGEHLLASLLAFNVGIEFGQLLVLSIVLPVLIGVLARLPRAERMVTSGLSLAIGAVAAVWLAERAGALAESGVPAAAVWSALFALAVAVAAWVARFALRARMRAGTASELSGAIVTRGDAPR